MKYFPSFNQKARGVVQSCACCDLLHKLGFILHFSTSSISTAPPAVKGKVSYFINASVHVSKAKIKVFDFCFHVNVKLSQSDI